MYEQYDGRLGAPHIQKQEKEKGGRGGKDPKCMYRKKNTLYRLMILQTSLPVSSISEISVQV